jgi:valyl-tRNA synthetase
MELSKNFEPTAVETKWTNNWKIGNYFSSSPNHLPAYTVVIPPPNVTGVLHMGHTLNETVQDILIRRARMTGYNACWVPGSDHASIATEAKVVQMLKEKGIDKNSLSRTEFLKYAFEWKEKYGGIIYNQIERLGCSVDWSRVSFTMDNHYYQSVIKTFIDLYNKGLIYRGARMINWDVAAKTALSDEEVEFKDVEGKLFHIKYLLENSNEFITIATQRPETIMGDTAICVNPNDERYQHLKGCYAYVPLINKKIPIIFDEYVDPAFGTGCLKVTPAHDINDYNLGLKHNLEIIDTLNEDGTLSEAAKILVGEDRFKARKKIIELLTAENLFIKEETYKTRMGYSQRTGVVVEPKISTQWFLKMEDLAKPALDAVVSGKIKIHPGDRFMATYKHWLENVKDWCISRQLWWGQQIPAWYDADGKMVVAETEAEAKEQFKKLYQIENVQVKQDADVLDTWFSSWLWPIEVFKGISNPNNDEIKYYYPTSTLVTGQDIIFFWVARMVMAGMEYMNEIPFKDVYFTGMVRDKQGRKMSKSLGNSPDLLNLIDTYGADAVRFGIMISSPAGNDLLFDEASLEQGKFFNNKMWNAFKLLKMWEANVGNQNNENTFAIDWFQNKLAQAQQEIAIQLKELKLSEALKTIYSLIWDDYCSWYLEWIKPEYGQPIDEKVLAKTKNFFTQLLELLHPFMPFITEELNQLLDNNEVLCTKQIQIAPQLNLSKINEGQHLKNIITAVRDIRNKQQLKPKETVVLHVNDSIAQKLTEVNAILLKQVNAESIITTDIAPEHSFTAVVEKDQIFVTSQFFKQDTEAQTADLQKELDRLNGFLLSIDKKLSNEKFVANAKPEVIALEQKKKADALEKIKLIEATLNK